METLLSYVVLTLVVLAVIVSLIFRRRPTISATVITNPVLGALNLEGPSADQTVEADLHVLSTYFSAVRRSDDVPPLCDVLLLYCEIDSSGSLNDSPKRIREIIRDAGATIAVVGTNNTPENYVAAIPKAPFGSANLIMTIDRKGPLFAGFLARLFRQMKDGISMPVAWNNLAPQNPHAMHEDLPSTICALERGQVVFG